MQQLNIPIIWGSEFDLRLINTAFINLKFVKVNDDDFVGFFSQFFAKSFIVQEGFLPNFLYSKTSFDNFHKDKYAIIPTSTDYTLFEDNYNKLVSLLQIVYPCDLQVERIIHIDLENPSFNYTQYDIHRGFLHEKDSVVGTQLYPFGKMLRSQNVKTDDLNSFLIVGIKNYDLYQFTIEVYIQSYYNTSLIFQYVALCMAIESTLSNDSKTEISYRFSRNTSILCGITKENCQLVYSFLKKAYSLRSDIVHGNDKLKYRLVYNNVTSLRNIVSILLINLLSNGITKKDLNDKIHSIGFGQRDLLSSPFIEHLPNFETLGSLSSIEYKNG